MKTKAKRQGFTLIEVALAIVVVAVGIMAVFSLLGSGLDSCSKAIAETQAAIFADNVFNGLRSAALTQAESSNSWWIGSNDWHKFWQNVKSGDTNITVASCGMWKNSSGAKPLIISGQDNPVKGYNCIAFTNLSIHGSSEKDTIIIVNGGMRYRLDVNGPTNIGAGLGEKVSAKLSVWPGLYGGATLNTNEATIFYTEFNDPGNL